MSNNSPHLLKDAHILIPRAYECEFTKQRGIEVLDQINIANQPTLK